MMNDRMIKTLAYNKQVRILFADNTNLINEICKDKHVNRTLKTALGRTVTIASLISGTLKDKQRVSIRVNGSNRKHKIFADIDSMGNVRGYINDELSNASLAFTENLSIEQLIGENGCIQVLKDLGMNSIFTGITDMPYGNITDDFAHFFRQSEQIPTLFFTTMIYNENNEVVLSRGVMAQSLPGAPEYLIDTIKEVLSMNQPIISNNDKHVNFNDLPHAIFKDIEIMGYSPIQYFCGCSKEILYSMLYSLDNDELMDAYMNIKPIEMVCNVCGKKYSFNRDEIGSILDANKPKAK